MTTKGQKKPRAKRTDDELYRASLEVQFEVAMLGNTLQQLLDSTTGFTSSRNERLKSNLLLHSFLLASRNLLAFLYSHDPRLTDLIAEDFFDSPSDWRRVRPSVAVEVTDGTISGNISKRLAHLTWDRTEKKSTWGAFAVAWVITGAMREFVRSVLPARMAPQLLADAELAHSALSKIMDEHSVTEASIGPLSGECPYTSFDLQGLW
ncbi:MAG: hypothetical protein IT348_19395 [Candidatus Eisenbacteria bacterium]|nr:hypothetical protein [Candidatus Eisenbacteria bacterium]